MDCLTDDRCLPWMVSLHVPTNPCRRPPWNPAAAYGDGEVQCSRTTEPNETRRNQQAETIRSVGAIQHKMDETPDLLLLNEKSGLSGGVLLCLRSPSQRQSRDLGQCILLEQPILFKVRAQVYLAVCPGTRYAPGHARHASRCKAPRPYAAGGRRGQGCPL